MQTISCIAPYASGGLGQHFADLVERAREAGNLQSFITIQPRANDPASRTVHLTPASLFQRLRYRIDPARRLFDPEDQFDRLVAQSLQQPLPDFMGFCGQSARSLARARELGCAKLSVVAACSHVNNVRRRHDESIRRYPVESSWMGEDYRRKAIQEYAAADFIIVASEYTRQSFLHEGVPSEKLLRFHYRTDPRFKPPERKPSDGIFRIVYTGSVTVMKGVPVLIEAFAKLAGPKAELTLVGGSGTRGMRKYLDAALKRDPRIRLSPGDPLPHLQRANAYVHPSFEDGHAYAPMEALACGVPVIVSEDTGMKEHVREGENGYVVPTGDVDVLFDRLQKIRNGELKASEPR